MSSYDVVIYGATSGGVCAAVAAADAGARVGLIEPGRHVGGMTSGGLGYTDVGDVRVLGGFAARLRQEIADHYGVEPGHYAGPEPHVAEQIYLRWLEQAGVEIHVDHALTAVTTTRTATGPQIDALHMCATDVAPARPPSSSQILGAVFIDASYEGDLLAAAGVRYAVGRESRTAHRERFAGRQELMPSRHSIPPWISPFADSTEPGVVGRLLQQIRSAPMAEVGDGDGGVMSYGYRPCLTTAPDRLPFMRSEAYQDDYWELGRRLFAHWERAGSTPPASQLIGLEPNLPNGKCDGNSLGPFSLSVLDGTAWEYPEADRQRREQIRRHHADHARDFLWFLANDPAVPELVRAEMNRWGLPPDEFADTGHLPHQLYVREARRMVGEYVLTEHDLLGSHNVGDVVAMGSYNIDVREVQRNWRWAQEYQGPIAMIVSEGYLSVPVPPYPIPYRCIVPQRQDCTNLLVPVCLSASHVAFSSVRMEVQYQMLGHVAGLAAARASGSEHNVQDLDVSALQEELRDAGQVLTL